MEIWKAIEDYEGIAEVSNYGRVRTLDRINNTGRRIKGKEKKLTLRNDGYYCVGLDKEGKNTNFKVNRLVAIAFVPNPKNKPFVDHIDGNRINDIYTNLRWVDAQENRNNKECIKKHSQALRGQMAGNTNPSARKVRCIETGEIFDTMKEAAEKYNASISTICAVCNGRQKTTGFSEELGIKLSWEYKN